MNISVAASFLCACAVAVDAFTLRPLGRNPAGRPPTTALSAAGGAPQYEKLPATLREVERVADGSYMLRIDADGGEVDVDYEPGHVLALEVPADEGALEEGSKAANDAAANGGWTRGPYTVSRSSGRSIDVLIKAVGEKSRRMAAMEPGAPFRFGGRFHVPILEGISADSTDRVAMVSTGVGVGPCVGAIEEALRRREGFPPIDLIASYRTRAEVAFEGHLDDLQRKHPERFSWKAVVTEEDGRLSSDRDSLRALTESSFPSGPRRTHYHLIGNGQMVSDFKTGLERAGVPAEKITIEMYFNHRAEIDEGAVELIAEAVTEASAVGAAK